MHPVTDRESYIEETYNEQPADDNSMVVLKLLSVSGVPFKTSSINFSAELLTSENGTPLSGSGL
jgi:hypothetical protein